ncbi:MAG: energy transducer TonB [Hyphomonas sp.]
MNRKLLAISACLLLVLPATAETCSNTRFRDKGLKLAREAYPQLVGQAAEWTFTREALMAQRQNERTCAGQASLDYLLLLADVQKGELQDAVAAMGGVMRSGSSALEKKRMMDRLINRFVLASEISTAIDLLRHAMTNFPDDASGYAQNLALLLAGRGRFDEARALADSSLEKALEDPLPGRIPHAGWVRLAVSEVSGDKADEADVIARLRTRFGEETEALIARDLPASNFAMLLKREFGSDKYPVPLQMPKPRYPEAMARAGLDGLCDVRFDISLEGVPEFIEAECDVAGFAEESVRAVSEVRFKPPVIDGVPYRVYNVIYPFEYHIR